MTIRLSRSKRSIETRRSFLQGNSHSFRLDGKLAVVTGGASGIGRAVAQRFASSGACVRVLDIDEGAAKTVASEIASSGGNAKAYGCDVSQHDSVKAAFNNVFQEGRVHILMNNAGIQPGSSMFGADANWERVLEVNLWGVIRGTQTFVPGMIARGRPGLIINTGSKQGITTPPGDPAYNVSKAALKAFTEALQHELRNTPGCQISAHLLIPGFVFTDLAARGRTEKPAAAWTAEQTVDFMMERLDAKDFYILCPDNDVPRSLDERRILWAAGDIVENRPPLSRWHPDYKQAFEAYIQKKD